MDQTAKSLFLIHGLKVRALDHAFENFFPWETTAHKSISQPSDPNKVWRESHVEAPDTTVT
jgi:hypothetical protein